MIPEAGLPITRRTLCRVGAHAFVWAGGSPDGPQHPATPCDCGLVTWAQVVVETARGNQAQEGGE